MNRIALLIIALFVLLATLAGCYTSSMYQSVESQTYVYDHKVYIEYDFFFQNRSYPDRVVKFKFTPYEDDIFVTAMEKSNQRHAQILVLKKNNGYYQFSRGKGIWVATSICEMIPTIVSNPEQNTYMIPCPGGISSIDHHLDPEMVEAIGKLADEIFALPYNQVARQKEAAPKYYQVECCGDHYTGLDYDYYAAMTFYTDQHTSKTYTVQTTSDCSHFRVPDTNFNAEAIFLAFSQEPHARFFEREHGLPTCYVTREDGVVMKVETIGYESAYGFRIEGARGTSVPGYPSSPTN